MLLVCSNCSARYLVSSDSLGEEGRDVRCAKCDHEWYQESDDLAPQEESYQSDELEDEESIADESEVEAKPEPESEISEEEPAEEKSEEDKVEPVEEREEEPPVLQEDIPDSVKPDPEKSNVPAFAKDVVRPQVSFQGKLTGYLAALMLFGLLIVAAFFFRQEVVSLWTPSAAIYELAGVDAKLKGESLVMESLSAEIEQGAEGRNILHLQGRVINLTKDVQQVPQLLARLRSTNGDDGDSWNIDTPLELLEPGESFIFKSDYPAVPHGVGSVNLTFVPMMAL